MEKCKLKKFKWDTRKVKKSPFGNMKRAKKTEKNFFARKSIGFTATSSLKAMGRIPRSDGCYRLGPKYL